MASNSKKSFVLYHDIRTPLELLDDCERGKLFLAILNYSEFGTLPDFGGALQMAFAFIRAALDRDADKWEDVRQKRAEAGKQGGIKSGESRREANEANASKSKQTKQNEANEAVPGPVPVPGPVLDNVSVKNGIGADKPPRSTVFQPPTVEEVAAYCRERGNKVDPQRFVDFYTASGWNRGKTKIKDWRACVRTWEKGERNGIATGTSEDVSKRTAERFTGLYDVNG